jgi:hypothetical protein
MLELFDLKDENELKKQLLKALIRYKMELMNDKDFQEKLVRLKITNTMMLTMKLIRNVVENHQTTGNH